MEQIIIKLREVEVLCGQGNTIAEAIRQIGVSQQTYYRWHRQYGGMNTTDEAFGRDLQIDEPGDFVNGGYMVENGNSFTEYYRDHGDIPEGSRIFAFSESVF